MIYKTLLETIGNTPLIRIPFPTPATILAKLEYFNPSNSLKDRSALYMIEAAEKRGDLQPGGTIIDASSGNHGISVAMIGKAKGYKVIIVVSTKTSKEKLSALYAYGAEVVVCEPTPFIDDEKSYHNVSQKLAASLPNACYLNQYYNTENRDAHYKLLGPEIWSQTAGKVTHFFAGAGTGGTVSGVGRYLKEKNPATTICAVDALTSFRATKGNPKPYKIEGLGIDFTSEVLDYSVIDYFAEISDESAFDALRLLVKEYGLLVGPTSGAVIAACLEKLPTFTEKDTVVLIFGDSGRAYLSKNFYLQPDNPQDVFIPQHPQDQISL